MAGRLWRKVIHITAAKKQRKEHKKKPGHYGVPEDTLSVTYFYQLSPGP